MEHPVQLVWKKAMTPAATARKFYRTVSLGLSVQTLKPRIHPYQRYSKSKGMGPVDIMIVISAGLFYGDGQRHDPISKMHLSAHGFVAGWLKCSHTIVYAPLLRHPASLRNKRDLISDVIKCCVRLALNPDYPLLR